MVASLFIEPGRSARYRLWRALVLLSRELVLLLLYHLRVKASGAVSLTAKSTDALALALLVDRLPAESDELCGLRAHSRSASS